MCALPRRAGQPALRHRSHQVAGLCHLESPRPLTLPAASFDGRRVTSVWGIPEGSAEDVICRCDRAWLCRIARAFLLVVSVRGRRFGADWFQTDEGRDGNASDVQSSLRGSLYVRCEDGKQNPCRGACLVRHTLSVAE